MRTADRIILAVVAVALVAAGYLAGNRTEVVNVPTTPAPTVEVAALTVDEQAEAYCRGYAGQDWLRDRCVYVTDSATVGD